MAVLGPPAVWGGGGVGSSGLATQGVGGVSQLASLGTRPINFNGRRKAFNSGAGTRLSARATQIRELPLYALTIINGLLVSRVGIDCHTVQD